jgi:hypothetical protein
MIESFPNFKNMISILYSAFRSLIRQDQKNTSPQHIIVKTSSTENKERTLKAAREKHQVTYKGKLIRITADFFKRNVKDKRAYHIFQALKENNCQPRLLWAAKLSFITEGGIKIFQDKEKLKQFRTTKLAL